MVKRAAFLALGILTLDVKGIRIWPLVSIFPAVFVGNAYRQQLFSPFISSQSFGRRPHVYLYSEWVLNSSRLGSIFYKMLLFLAEHVILSDLEGAEVLRKYSLGKGEKVFWYVWNDADEVKGWPLEIVKSSHPKLKLCLGLETEAKKCEMESQMTACHLKIPILPRKERRPEQIISFLKVCTRGLASAKKTTLPRPLISYVGEVDIFEGLEKENQALDDHLWKLAEWWTPGQPLGLESIDVGDISLVRILIILRYRIRYHYAKALKNAYGKDFALMGNSWKKYGIDGAPFDYNAVLRGRLYAASKICVDFLSGNAFDGHYARTAELISCSNGILQLQTIDSRSLFEDQFEMRTFCSFSELQSKIADIARMSDSDLAQLGSTLRNRLAIQTHIHNRQQIIKVAV